MPLALASVNVIQLMHASQICLQRYKPTKQYATMEGKVHQHARADSKVFDATDLYRSFGMMGTFSKRDFGSKPSVKKATPISAAMVFTCVTDSTCQDSSMLAGLALRHLGIQRFQEAAGPKYPHEVHCMKREASKAMARNWWADEECMRRAPSLPNTDGGQLRTEAKCLGTSPFITIIWLGQGDGTYLYKCLYPVQITGYPARVANRI